MLEFFNQFEDYCRTPGIESGKARSYVNAIQYLCDYLNIHTMNIRDALSIKKMEDQINDKNSVLYKGLLSFLSARRQKSYLEKGYIKAALKYLFAYFGI